MSVFSRGLSVALLLLYVGASTASRSAPPASPTAHVPAKRSQVNGIANFAKVTPFLYRGAQPHATGFQELKKMGVDIIVDLRLSGTDREKAQVTKLGMQYVSIPWHCLFPKDENFAQFLKVLHDHPKKIVFVHCRYGDDRTGMAIAAYRMAFEGWTAAEARNEMDQFGFHHIACSSLVNYERNFPDRLKKNSAFEGLKGMP
jgi:tyrosine-protein phosphatase SIW14